MTTVAVLGSGIMGSALDDQGPRAFRIGDVCARTGLGRTTIYAAIKGGLLVARKHGRRTVVLVDDLAAFLEGLPTAKVPGLQGEDEGL